RSVACGWHLTWQSPAPSSRHCALRSTDSPARLALRRSPFPLPPRRHAPWPTPSLPSSWGHHRLSARQRFRRTVAALPEKALYRLRATRHDRPWYSPRAPYQKSPPRPALYSNRLPSRPASPAWLWLLPPAPPGWCPQEASSFSFAFQTSADAPRNAL